MTSIPTRRQYTVDEYFQLEEKSVEKHEYHNGEIFCMAGGTSEHSAIIMNAAIALGNALKGSPCRLYDSNLRVAASTKSRFVYPDIHVVCGPPQHDPRDTTRGTTLNPRVVIEVLSKTTEAYDRGRKFEFYRDVESMQEYVLISQREPVIETFLRKGHGDWAIATARGLEASVKLQSLEITIPLLDVYDGIAFTPINPDETGELLP
jgi:Uma2 family endonuclease